MYEFWKLECLEAAKEFKEEMDRLYYPDAPWLVYGPIQAQQVMFDEVTAMLYREICRPKILSQGRALNPFLVEPEKRITVTKEVNGKLVEKKEWVPDEEGDMFPYIEWCNHPARPRMRKRAPLTMQLPAGSDSQSPKQVAETMRIARTKEVS